MQDRILLAGLVTLFLAAQSFLAVSAFHMQAQWSNVPPVPSREGISALSLGDDQFAYRNVSLMLQNLGNLGGQVQPLANYDYKRLGEWFSLADTLDPVSEYVPLLAGYYFSATPRQEDLTPVIDYLGNIGLRSEYQKWHWLAQAVYLARFRQHDLPKAYSLAQSLSAQWIPGRPQWMKQMPAFIRAEEGDRAAAYDMMIRILKEDSGTMQPAEINFMVDYICTRILTEPEARINPLCVPK